MADLPETKTLVVSRDRTVLTVVLSRPEVRNAMSLEMVSELERVAAAVASDRSLRSVVLRGANRTFCSGGDLKDMAKARTTEATPEHDPIFETNRAFGRMLERLEALPQALIAVCEGAVLGGGFGLACVADVTLTEASAEFGLPETARGLPPAQIAPFLVKRLGLSETRRLAVTGGRLDGREALRIGLAHECFEGSEALEAGLRAVLGRIAVCAPGALATTKRLVLATNTKPLAEVLDDGARAFSECARGPEGQEGMIAFVQKRKTSWDDSEAGR